MRRKGVSKQNRREKGEKEERTIVAMRNKRGRAGDWKWKVEKERR